MYLYPVASVAGASFGGDGEVPGGGLIVAFRPEDVASPLRSGRAVGDGDRSALVIGGTERIRTGEVTVFCKVVTVTPAVVRRDGRVQAQGSPAEHATLGPAEEWLDRQAGPGVIDQIAERAALREQFVKGKRKRLLTRAFMIRVIVLMTLMPEARTSARRSSCWPGTWPWCRGRGPGFRRRRGRSGTGGTRSARRRWRNCGPSCWARPGSRARGPRLRVRSSSGGRGR